jgi:hypothetical protein
VNPARRRFSALTTLLADVAVARPEVLTMTRIPACAWKFALTCAAAAALAACGGGGGDGSKSTTGTLKLGITDAPVDVAEAVVVRFTGVELKPVNAAPISVDFAAPKDIDLYTLQGPKRELLLTGEAVPAGEYEWMRLKVAVDPTQLDSYVEVSSGQVCEMRIPSGAETGLKLVHHFTVGIGAITDLTIDFDLRKSLVQPPGQKADQTTCDSNQVYLLKPALRVVDNLTVGSISGKVDSAQLPAGCVAGGSNPTYPGNVYLFGPYTDTDPVPLVDDVDRIPDDVGGADPITTARVDADTFTYAIGFVPAGKYVIAYTCSPDDSLVDADTDVPTPPAVDEVVTFSPDPGLQIQVTANQVKTVDFPVVTQ